MLTQVFVDSLSTGDLISEAFQNGVLLGLIMGLSGIVFFALLYVGMKRASLKRYILYADEQSKADVMTSIRLIRDTADAMAVKTNTTFFKSLANEYHSLVAFIKKRNLS